MRKMVVAALAATMLAGSAQAAYTITFAEVGSDVVAIGTGTLNITGLSFLQSDTSPFQIWPARGWVLIGGANAGDLYQAPLTISGSLGAGGQRIANSGAGGKTGILGTSELLFVPTGYVSGTLTTSTSTFTNSSFRSLGLDPGATLTATFNSGANVDTLSVVVPGLSPAIPEPASWTMMITGFGLVGATLRRRKIAISLA